MNNIKNNLTILVNTSDGFEDCWYPFFNLFGKNWNNCQYPILLNTEFKDFCFNGLNIKSSRSHKDTLGKKLTWSECLINALNQIETPLVLYFQEDYFLDQPVNVPFIESMVELMLENSDIKRLGLVTFDSFGKFELSDYPELCIVSQNASYRISTQVSLWRKETLLNYLNPEENGWMFEIFGTWRSRKQNKLFLSLNREIFNNTNKIVSYLHTGIIKGKWHPEIPALFKENGIILDFSKRGFYDLNISTYKRRLETFKKLLASPKLFLNALKNLI